MAYSKGTSYSAESAYDWLNLHFSRLVVQGKIVTDKARVPSMEDIAVNKDVFGKAVEMTLLQKFLTGFLGDRMLRIASLETGLQIPHMVTVNIGSHEPYFGFDLSNNGAEFPYIQPTNIESNALMSDKGYYKTYPVATFGGIRTDLLLADRLAEAVGNGVKVGPMKYLGEMQQNFPGYLDVVSARISGAANRAKELSPKLFKSHPAAAIDLNFLNGGTQVTRVQVMDI